MLTVIPNTFRLLGILRTLARHDALWPLDMVPRAGFITGPAKFLWGRKKSGGRPGERLADALTELGPSFIKLGQALSVRADLIGEEVATDLSRLQDNLPPFDSKIARKSIEEELGAPVTELFARFEETPVAAASIAQVHFAETPDGREVAVKVLRPDIERRFDRDIDLFHWLAQLAETVLPFTRRLRPVDVVDTFKEWIETEMDLRLEGSAASELAEYSADIEGFRVVQVDWERTARRVLTTERVRGLRIDDIAGLKAAGFDVDVLLERSAKVFFLQVFRDGFFHADMHPGNMFVDQDGILTPVDFGIMGRVDKRTRLFLADILVGFLNRDYASVARVHFDYGIVPPYKSREAFTQAIRAIGEPVLGRPLNEISVGKLLAQLFQVTEDFDMETQPNLLLLQKTILVAEGVGRKLNPRVNMWVMAQPLIEDWMMANRGPEARMRDAVSDGIDILTRLPATLLKVEAVLNRLEEEQAGGAPDRGQRKAAPNRQLAPHQRWNTVLLAAILVTVLVAALAD